MMRRALIVGTATATLLASTAEGQRRVVKYALDNPGTTAFYTPGSDSECATPATSTEKWTVKAGDPCIIEATTFNIADEDEARVDSGKLQVRTGVNLLGATGDEKVEATIQPLREDKSAIGQPFKSTLDAPTTAELLQNGFHVMPAGSRKFRVQYTVRSAKGSGREVTLRDAEAELMYETGGGTPGTSGIRGQDETPSGMSLWGPNKENNGAGDIPQCLYNLNTNMPSGNQDWWNVTEGDSCSRTRVVDIDPDSSARVTYTMRTIGRSGAEEVVVWAEPLGANGQVMSWPSGERRKIIRRVLLFRNSETVTTLGPLDLPPGARSLRTTYHINGAQQQPGVTYQQPRAAFAGQQSATQAPTGGGDTTPTPATSTPPAVTRTPVGTPRPTAQPNPTVTNSPRSPPIGSATPTPQASPGGAGQRSTDEEDDDKDNSALWALLAIPVGLLLLAALLAGLMMMRKKQPKPVAARAPDSYTEDFGGDAESFHGVEVVETTIVEAHQHGRGGAASGMYMSNGY